MQTPSAEHASCAAHLPCLSKDEINLLPIRAWEGDIVVIQTENELDAALNELWKESVLGFDTETRPTFTKGQTALPALIQFATRNCAYLIQLTHVALNQKLACLLSSAGNIKAGVAIRDDMKALARRYPFTAAGTADLAVLAKARGIQAQGLRTLSANLLGFRISKAAQCSNWENSVLTPQQIKYAATDAWVGREIYLRLASYPEAPQKICGQPHLHTA
ncbi:MAG: 3'-5' exonuclease domain-containing protein 2 [Mailhella sp.]|nr:3'-5' exonuclease domain-containing protein 2 [Mailhella sp.]